MVVRRLAVFASVVLAGGCSGDDGQTSGQSASLSAQALVTGPLRNGRVSFDQLRLDDGTGAVREHVGDTMTDAEGRFSFSDLGTKNGLFRLTVRGGEFDDLATGATVVLDPSAEITSLLWIDLFETREGAVVNPVSALVDVLARQRLSSGNAANIGEARDIAADHLHKHFGDLDWSRIEPASLEIPAVSPVDEWRAAALLGGYALLADDIRTASGSSVSEVNAYTMTVALAQDVSTPPFDGNDQDERGTGLQIGECPAVDPSCVVPPETATFCPRGACRALCDAYSGTLRGLYSGAALKLVRSPTFNQSGIDDTAFLPIARALADANDTLLFGDYCTDDVDRTPPSLVFEVPPTPSADAWVKDSFQVRVRATDDIDIDPDLALLGGLVDDDGDPGNAIASVTIDSTALSDGAFVVMAEAKDAALNSATVSRSFRVDNTDPQIMISPTGFYVSGTDWWTENATPTIGGTVSEANLQTINVYDGATAVGTAVIGAGTWSLVLPAGTVPGVAGVMLRIEATDFAGNVASVTQRIRYDADPPVVTIPTSNVRDETGDTVAFTRVLDPIFGTIVDIRATHTHNGNQVMLGPSGACDTSAATPVVTKYLHLLDQAAPAYVSEVAGVSGEDPRNPLRWQFNVTDDGVGVDFATVQYRIRDVATDTYPLDWRSLSGGGAYAIPLYRTGTTWPSIAALGTKEGLYQIQFRGSDRMARPFTATRCWQHRILAPPLMLGPLDAGGAQSSCGSGPTSCAPTHGPDGSGKYALNLLALNDVSPPLDPIANEVLNDAVPGNGLMQFPVWNASTDPIYLSVDLANPAGPVYTKAGVENRWGYSETSTSTSCGPISGGGCDENISGCAMIAVPAQPAGATYSVSTPTAATVTYGIRVWEETSTTVYSELAPCVGCSVTHSLGNQRLTFRLPPRNAPSMAGDPAVPRKFWVMPTVKGVPDVRPYGVPPYSEISIQGVTLTGQIEETRTGCHRCELVGAIYRCTARRTYRRYRAMTQASFGLGADVASWIQTSWNGLDGTVRPPPHLGSQPATRFAPFTTWSTSEALPPIPPP